MKKTLFISMSIIFTMLFYACGPDDVKLQSDVKQAVTLNYPQVTVTVRNAIAALSGTVETEEAKTDAENIAKNVKGIKSVVNEINVVAPAPKITPDDMMRAAVIDAFNKEGFNDIGVQVKDSVITLTGDLKKADLKKVMQIANSAKANKVENQLNLIK